MRKTDLSQASVGSGGMKTSWAAEDRGGSRVVWMDFLVAGPPHHQPVSGAQSPRACECVEECVRVSEKRNHQLPELDSVGSAQLLNCIFVSCNTYKPSIIPFVEAPGWRIGSPERNFHISEGNTGGLG